MMKKVNLLIIKTQLDPKELKIMIILQKKIIKNNVKLNFNL